MAVVIRLQGLKLAADSRDIRKFFTGLKIPDGGVHIIGGELEEAFIMFISDEDARRAMARSGGIIRGAPVKLLLSSKAEMQDALEASTNAATVDQKRSVENLRQLQVESSMGAGITGDSDLGSRPGFSSSVKQSASASTILFLLGMPFSVTEQDVINFFRGLRINGIILLKNKRGLNGTGFVKFATVEDAIEGMKRNKEYMGSRFVELFFATEEQWHKASAGHVGMGGSAGGRFERGRSPVGTWRTQQHDVRSRSPLARRAGDPQGGRVSSGLSSHSSSTKYYIFLGGMPFQVTNKDIIEFFRGLHVEDLILLKNDYGQNNGTGLVKFGTKEDALDALKRKKEYIGSRYVDVSPASEQQWYKAVRTVEMSDNGDERFEQEGSPVGAQRNSRRDARSRSPLASRDELTSGREMCIMLDNLSYALEKESIRAFFRQAKLDNDQILFLFNPDGSRTRTAFVLFKSLGDYCAALSQAKHKELAYRHISISPVSREKMIALLTAETSKIPSETSGGFQNFLRSSPDESHDTEKACVHLRNLPFDVQKFEVMEFFLGFKITEDSVILLCDNNGVGVGEALVVFNTEAEAMNALSLNGRWFHGSEVVIKCITQAQMQEFGVEFPGMRRERHLDKEGEPSCHPQQEYFEPAHVPRTSLPDPCYGPREDGPLPSQYRGNGSSRGDMGRPMPNLDSATCLKLVNLPYQITEEEIYDFCYGYHIIPGSVTLLYDEAGLPRNAATVVFESRREALTAKQELSGRSIGPRKIQLEFI